MGEYNSSPSGFYTRTAAEGVTSRMRYAKSSCHICGRRISRNGLGFWNHCMAHVRRGEAKRQVRSDGVQFLPVPRMIQLTLDDALRAVTQGTGGHINYFFASPY